MDGGTIRHDALELLESGARETAALVEAADPRAVPPGMRWSVRDLAAHLTCATALYIDLASGTRSPLDSMTPEALRAFNEQRIADVVDTEPEQLAKSIVTLMGRFVDIARRRPIDAPVSWHAGVTLDTAQLACVLLGEYVLHGLDIATAVVAPWPITPTQAALVLYGYGPVYPACVDPVTSAGHSAGYELDLGAAGRLGARFDAGSLTLAPVSGNENGAWDCTITAEPTAFLLVSAGRMPQATAIALGLLGATGTRPELGLTFGRLFRYP
jgi:hypothetical protein